MRTDGIDVRLVIPAGPSTPTSITAPAHPPTGSPSSGALPRTGIELVALLVVAIVLLTLGALVLQAGRARRNHPA